MSFPFEFYRKTIGDAYRTVNNMEKCALEKFNNYDELNQLLMSVIIKSGFSHTETILTETGERIEIYSKKRPLSLELFMLVHVTELNKSNYSVIYNSFVEFVTQYYRHEWGKERINLLFLICVDRATPSIYVFVNQNIRQRMRVNYIPVGIIIDEDLVTMSKPQKHVIRYCLMKNKFLKLLKKNNVCRTTYLHQFIF